MVFFRLPSVKQLKKYEKGGFWSFLNYKCMTAILGTIGLAATLLFVKAVYLGGLYDTWASGGGDVRVIIGGFVEEM